MTCLPLQRNRAAGPTGFAQFDPPPETPDEAAWLALFLGDSGRVRDPGATARTLIGHFGGLAAVLAADGPELVRAAALDAEVIAELRRARNLSVLLVRAAVTPRPSIGSWASLLAYVRVALAEEPREQFRCLFLDRRNGLMRDELIGNGTVDHAPVYPREVVRRALELSASALILVHNHPSGDPTPSQADIATTRQIIEAARLFKIEVHDHLVVGRGGTASFKSLRLI